MLYEDYLYFERVCDTCNRIIRFSFKYADYVVGDKAKFYF